MGGTTRAPKSLTPPRTTRQAAGSGSYGWDDDETYGLNHPENLVDPPSASEEYWSPQHLYHGTSAELRPGDMIEGGHPSNFDKSKGRLDHAYATPRVSTAAGYAETAAQRKGGHPRVYEVDRAHDMMPDPEQGAAFGIDSQAYSHPDWRSKAGFRVLRELHTSEFGHHLTEDWPGMGERTARWQPSSGIFGPTTGLDQTLFDEHGTLRPGVRHDVMTRLDQCIRTDSGLAGSEWQDWTRVYLTGGSVSEWAGPRPNEKAQDLDVIVAIDLAAAQRDSAFEGMSAGEAASALNAAFWKRFNVDRWRPEFGGTWELTAFCNQRAWDVTAIKPYAAYDLTDSRWAVRPPHLPGHSLADFDPAVVAQARAVAAEARAVLRMPEPLRTREATALWERIHAGRSRAFSDQGTGWDDPANVTEKWLAYAPRDLLGHIRDLALAPRTAAAGGLEGITFTHVPPLPSGGGVPMDRHAVYAQHPEAPDGEVPRQAGYIRWWGDTGRVSDLQVHPGYQRRGIATELYRRAAEVTPHIRHSDNLSPDARAWISGTQGKTAAWDSSGSDHSGVYLRFGDWPHDERSFSPAGGYHEDGVSVYDLDREGDPAIDDGLNRAHEHDEYCDPDDCRLNEDDPGNDPQEEMRGRVVRAERARDYGRNDPKSVGHLVRGEMSAIGYDGEPLLRNVRRVGDWIDHRHLFLDQARPHRLARDPSHEDYEEPEEKPPYGYRNRTAAVTATAVGMPLAPWMQWAGDQPHKAVINRAQENLREEHPELTAPLDHRDPDDLPLWRNRDSEAGGQALSAILRSAGHPGADSAWVTPHPDPRGSSQVAVDKDGSLGAVLLPGRWDLGTVAHEGAHLVHARESGLDLAAMAHGEHPGGEVRTGVPDHVMHGPDFARHLANALDVVSPGAGDDFMRHRQTAVGLIGNVRARFHKLPREFEGSEPIRREAVAGVSYNHLRGAGTQAINAHPTGAEQTKQNRIGRLSWGEDGQIVNLWVHPDYQRQGIATEMYRRASELAPGLHHAPNPTEDGRAWISGMERKATSGEGVSQRPKRVPGNAMVYLDVPHGTVKPYEGHEGEAGHHVALAYLPRKIGDEDFARVVDRAREAATRHAPMKATVSGGMTFPPGTPSDRRRASVVAVHAPGIHALHGEFSEFDRAHYEAYTPHVTRAQLGGHQEDPPPHPEASFPVTHVHVRRGDEVHSFPLTGPAQREAAVEPRSTDMRWDPTPQRIGNGYDSRPLWMRQDSAVHDYVTRRSQHEDETPEEFEQRRKDIARYGPHLKSKDRDSRVLERYRDRALNGGPIGPDPYGPRYDPDEIDYDSPIDWGHPVNRREASAEAGPPGVLYHVSPRSNREEIRENGLLAEYAEGPEAVYLHEVPGTGAKRGDDTWHVDSRGLDLLHDPHDMCKDPGCEFRGEGSWYTPDDVPPGRLSLHLGQPRQAASGYTDLKPRSGMIYLDLPPGTVRPVPGGVDDHHITVVYLGSDVSDDAFAEACRRTKAAAARLAPMDGVLRGIDIFPPSKSSDGKVPAFVPAYIGGVGLLRRELEDLSASEHKDWRPHITLAYMEEGDSLPAPHPAVLLRFDRVHVKRGDDVVSFPLTGR